MPLLATIIIGGLLALISIFNFKNRVLQKRITGISVLLVLVTCVWIYYYASFIPGTDINYGAGIFMPVLALVFCFLALRGIRKDEQLLKSAERLR
jgi:peptidoglycan/LPS O-acetylase OafA/YrhL